MTDTKAKDGAISGGLPYGRAGTPVKAVCTLTYPAATAARRGNKETTSSAGTGFEK